MLRREKSLWEKTIMRLKVRAFVLGFLLPGLATLYYIRFTLRRKRYELFEFNCSQTKVWTS